MKNVFQIAESVEKLYNVSSIEYITPILKDLTDNNSHSEAAFIVTHIFGSSQEKETVLDIYRKHIKLGYLEGDDSEIRRNILNDILDRRCSFERNALKESL